ncbi:hypothetical protein GCM10011571_17490 [Marinithermofilum abyssi]|uniref:Uncharacterized protein n=1 Tax=Marinithermofilum abyssi TaxID=1571185 RepID=A0A8J2VGG0_9BACL|nr:hypothetical protein GCM10011571_17490 [Marinithermofilum abyssi]
MADLRAHRQILKEEKKALRYAKEAGDYKKACRVQADMLWRESEIRKLANELYDSSKVYHNAI